MLHSPEKISPIHPIKIITFGGGDVLKRIKKGLEGLGENRKISGIVDPFSSTVDPNLRISALKTYIESERKKHPDQTIAMLDLSPSGFHEKYLGIANLWNCPYYGEKPLAVNLKGLETIGKIVNEKRIPIYFGDHYEYRCAGFFAAQLPKESSPFYDFLHTGKILQDETGMFEKIFSKRESFEPLIKEVKTVRGAILESKDSLTGKTDHRAWLQNLEKGGGMLLDLIVHLLDPFHALGYKIDQNAYTEMNLQAIDNNQEYVPIPEGSEAAEIYARLKGATTQGIHFDFEVGKYYPGQTKKYFEMEGTDGSKITVDFGNQTTTYSDPHERKSILKMEADAHQILMADFMNHVRSNDKTAKNYDRQAETIRDICFIQTKTRGGKVAKKYHYAV